MFFGKSIFCTLSFSQMLCSFHDVLLWNHVAEIFICGVCSLRSRLLSLLSHGGNDLLRALRNSDRTRTSTLKLVFWLAKMSSNS